MATTNPGGSPSGASSGLAGALTRLSSGQVSSGDSVANFEPAPPTLPTPPLVELPREFPPPVRERAGTPPVSGLHHRPAIPGEVPQAQPSPTSTSPANSSRSLSPNARWADVQQKHRQNLEAPPEPEQTDPIVAATSQQVEIIDGDLSDVPAPDESVFAKPHKSAKTRIAKPRVPLYKSIGFRRTIIPILFSAGLILNILAGLKFALDEDSPMQRLPNWTPPTVAGIGVLFLILAILNMLSVRSELRVARTSTT